MKGGGASFVPATYHQAAVKTSLCELLSFAQDFEKSRHVAVLQGNTFCQPQNFPEKNTGLWLVEQVLE